MGERLIGRFERDEKHVLGLLIEWSSVSGGIFGARKLDRALIRTVLAELSGSRLQQTTFCRVVCVPRIKFFQAGTL